MSVGLVTPERDEVTWSLLDSVRRIVRGRRLLLGTTAAGLALGVLLAFLMKPYYVAEAVFLPPKNTDLMAGVGQGSAAALLGQDQLSDTYLGLVASRTVADDVIDHLGLMATFRAKDRSQARGILAAVSRFGVNKNSFVTVEIKAGNAKLAAAIGNAYLDALYRLNGGMIESASSHRRAFFEAQLAVQKDALAAAELELKNSQERSGLVSPAGEAAAGISATASLQAQVNVAEARLAGLEVGGTEQNPEVVQARTLVGELRAQLARQQADSAAHGAGIASNKRLPGLALEYAQKEREVKLREAVYDSLVQQYEKARLSSIDPGPQLQVVDRAVEPEHKAGPNRRLIAGFGLMLGLVAGLAWLLLVDPIQRTMAALRSTPASGSR